MTWQQIYDPLDNQFLSTLAAAFPLVVLLGLLAWHKVRAHWAALAGLTSAMLVAVLVLRMPVHMALASAGFGAAYGLFPIGWIVLNVIFLYRLTSDSGYFAALQGSIATVTADGRLQLLLIAFSFGAFFEGAAGFGTPVAVTGALLIGLGFSPLQASGLSLIANTAPVAFGALGTPVIALQGVTGIDLLDLSAMIGRQLPVFSIIVPFWLIWAYVGFRRTMAIWPALLVAGVAFAVPQFLVSNYHGPWLVDVVASVASMSALVVFLRWWAPPDATVIAGVEATAAVQSAGDVSSGAVVSGAESSGGVSPDADVPAVTRIAPRKAWTPWIVLSLLVFVWGLPQMKAALNSLSAPKIAVPGAGSAGAARTTGRGRAGCRGGGVPRQLALRYGHGDFSRCVGKRAPDGVLAPRAASAIRGHAARGANLAPDHRRHVVVRLRVALLRHGRDIGARLRQNWLLVPVLRHHAGLVGCCAHRIGYLVQCSLRQPSDYDRAPSGSESDSDGRRQLVGRCDGKDDRCPEHRGGKHGHSVVWAREPHSSVRFFPQSRAGRPGRHLGHVTGVRVPLHADGRALGLCTDQGRADRRSRAANHR